MIIPTSFRLSPVISPLLAGVLFLTGCSPNTGRNPVDWAGSIDTLASGQIRVANPAESLWGPGEAWTVTEDLRIGRLDDPGPYEFSEITSLDVDQAGRIWVLDGQAQEIRVFDQAGQHVRTIGRKGSGPGEFNGAIHIQFGPQQHLWVVDPQNNRISVLDSAGTFTASHQVSGGFVMVPWPGGFDRYGAYYLPIPDFSSGEFRVALVRHDAHMIPLDTLLAPRDPIDHQRYELKSDDGRTIALANVPFTPSFHWMLSPEGTIWGLLTGEYRLFELSRQGDTLRTITRAYDPLPVSREDRARAFADLQGFTDAGGQVDASRIPNTKPAADGFFVDDKGRTWVARRSDQPRNGQVYDVFDVEGRFLGPVALPATLASVRQVVGDRIYGVTQNELGVPFVVRARIERGG